MFKKCIESCGVCLSKVEWLPALLTRVTVGWIFLESGYGKFRNLPNVVQFFTDLGIPFPQIQAPFVAGGELVCGGLLLLGLLTRLASVPLICMMVVALLTAKKEEIASFSDLFGMSEYLYIVLLVWLAFRGAGRFSVDQLCCKKHC